MFFDIHRKGLPVAGRRIVPAKVAEGRRPQQPVIDEPAGLPGLEHGRQVRINVAQRIKRALTHACRPIGQRAVVEPLQLDVLGGGRQRRQAEICLVGDPPQFPNTPLYRTRFFRKYH